MQHCVRLPEQRHTPRRTTNAPTKRRPSTERRTRRRMGLPHPNCPPLLGAASPNWGGFVLLSTPGLSPDLLSRHPFFPASQKGRQSPADFFAYSLNQKPAEVLLFLPFLLRASQKEVQNFNSEMFLFKNLSLILNPAFSGRDFGDNLKDRSRFAVFNNLAHLTKTIYYEKVNC